MGLCASSSSSASLNFPTSPVGKLRVVPGEDKYGVNPSQRGGNKFIIGEGNFSMVKLIRRTESPPESLKLCKFNGQGYRRVCLKLYHKEVLEANTMLLEKIIDASETSVELENPYIVRLFHSFHSTTSRIWYLATSPFVIDLIHYMDKYQNKGLDVNVGKQIGAEIALAVEALHKAGFVHGELRPGNVLISPAGHATISLYPVEVLCSGKSSLYELDHARFEPLSSTSQHDDSAMLYTKVDDWWCYGLILYQIFHGKPLFDGDTVDAVEAQKSVRPAIPINPSEKMLLNSPLHELIKGLLTIDETKRFGIKEVTEYYVFKENNIVDWKKTRYGEIEGLSNFINIKNVSCDDNVENDNTSSHIGENWEYNVSLLDAEQNTEVEEAVDAVLMGVIEDTTVLSEVKLFDSLCQRWDQNIEVDALNQFSLNLQVSKFDNFVAYGTKVKAKTGRKIDEENLKQFVLLNETVGKTSKKVNQN